MMRSKDRFIELGYSSEIVPGTINGQNVFNFMTKRNGKLTTDGLFEFAYILLHQLKLSSGQGARTLTLGAEPIHVPDSMVVEKLIQLMDLAKECMSQPDSDSLADPECARLFGQVEMLIQGDPELQSILDKGWRANRVAEARSIKNQSRAIEVTREQLLKCLRAGKDLHPGKKDHAIRKAAEIMIKQTGRGSLSTMRRRMDQHEILDKEWFV